MKRILLTSLLIISALTVQVADAQKSKSPVVADSERTASVRFANGLKEYYSENYKSAEEIFTSLVTSDAKNAAAYFMLSQVKEKQSCLPEAEFYMNQAVKLDKSNVWYACALAEILDLQGKYSESEKVWAKVCKMDDDNEEYILAYAEACMNQNKLPQTIKLFDRLEQVVGTSEAITSAKVEMRLYLNDVKGAIGEYDRLISQFPNEESNYLAAAKICISNNLNDKAISYLNKAAALNPDNGAIQLQLGDYYASKGDDKAAFEARLAAVRSKELSIDQKLPILRTYLVSLKNGDATEEQIALSKALTEANPEALEGWAARGSIALRQKQYDEAATYFAKAISISNSVYAVWQDYLYCLIKLQKYDDILQNESDLTELFPTNSMIYHTLGVAYISSHRPADAIPRLEKALKYAYEKKEIALINAALAEAYEGLGNTAKADYYKQMGDRK